MEAESVALRKQTYAKKKVGYLILREMLASRTLLNVNLLTQA